VAASHFSLLCGLYDVRAVQAMLRDDRAALSLPRSPAFLPFVQIAHAHCLVRQRRATPYDCRHVGCWGWRECGK
jgi:hypothetical protein